MRKKRVLNTKKQPADTQRQPKKTQRQPKTGQKSGAVPQKAKADLQINDQYSQREECSQSGERWKRGDEHRKRGDEHRKRGDEHRKRGDELRQWQAEERAFRLMPLRRTLAVLCRRLLVAHPSWAAQEQIHLDHVSLEVAACPEAEAVLIEARRSEDLEWQGREGIEVCIVRFAPFCVTGALDDFEDDVDDFPEWPLMTMDMLVTVVERDVMLEKIAGGNRLDVAARQPDEE